MMDLDVGFLQDPMLLLKGEKRIIRKDLPGSRL